MTSASSARERSRCARAQREPELDKVLREVEVALRHVIGCAPRGSDLRDADLDKHHLARRATREAEPGHRRPRLEECGDVGCDHLHPRVKSVPARVAPKRHLPRENMGRRRRPRRWRVHRHPPSRRGRCRLGLQVGSSDYVSRSKPHVDAEPAMNAMRRASVSRARRPTR